jgi:hypothetical protein
MATTKIEGFSVSHAAILNGATPVSEVADIYGIREGTLDVDTDSYDNTGDDAVLSSWSWINFATVAIKSGFIPFEVIALLSGSTLVTTGITTAPVANTPSTATTGGTLTAGTYYYKVTAIGPDAESLPSNEVSQVTTGSTSTVTVTWGAVTGATGYRIYRGTAAGLQTVYYVVGVVTTFTDTGAAATTGTPPTTNVAAKYSLPLWNFKSMNQPARPLLIRVPSKDSNGTPRLFDIILYKVQFNPITFDGPTYKDGMALNYGGKALMADKDEAGVVLTEKAVGRLVSSQQV